MADFKFNLNHNTQTANDYLNQSQNKYAQNPLLDKKGQEAEILDALESHDMVYTNLLERRQVKTGTDFTFTVIRKDSIGTGVKLKEGIAPEAESWSAGKVSGTFSQYGKIIAATDVARDRFAYDPYSEQKSQLADSAARTQNDIIREELFHSAGLIAYPTVTNYTAGKRMSVAKTASKISEITPEFGFSYWDIKNIKRTYVKSHAWSQKDGAIKIVMSEDAMDSLRQDPWFVDALHANGMIDFWTPDPSNVGKYFEGFSFINAGADGKEYLKGEVVDILGTGADNTAACDLDATLIIAGHAGFVLSQAGGYAGGYNIQYFEHNTASKSDPLNQRFIAGYKFMLGVMVDTPIQVGVYFSAKSNQTSTGDTQKGKMDMSWLFPETTTISDEVVAKAGIKDFDTLKGFLQDTATKKVLSKLTLLSADDITFDKLMIQNPDGTNFWDGQEHAPVELTADVLKTLSGKPADITVKLNAVKNATVKTNDNWIGIHFNIQHLPVVATTPNGGGDDDHKGE